MEKLLATFVKKLLQKTNFPCIHTITPFLLEKICLLFQPFSIIFIVIVLFHGLYFYVTMSLTLTEED
jgi:hypothetical protein